MAVMIDIDVPNRCADCLIETNNGGMVYSCCITGTETEHIRETRRSDDCPLHSDIGGNKDVNID